MVGAGIGVVICILIWYVLQVIAYWKIFNKAGKPGWHSIIPILNVYDQFDMCWKGSYGLIVVIGGLVTSFLSNMAQNGDSSTLSYVSGAIAIICLVIGIIGLYRFAKCFGRGFLTFLGLLFLGPIFMLILGFGSARYIGKNF